jgi:hypothetical protein
MLAMATLCAASSAQVMTATYIGTDRVWNNAANWSTGMIPDTNTNIIIDGRDVDTDPTATYELKNVIVTGFGSITTKPGTIWRVEDETLINGTIIHQSTNGAMNPGIGTLTISNPIACSGFTCGGIKLNPTPKTKRIIVLSSSAQISMGLGGSTASSATQQGNGTYSTLSAEEVTLGGRLELESYYGFTPTAGQSFNIIKASRSMTGQFAGLGEGAYVGQVNGAGMRISYLNNQVAVTAVPEPATMIALATGFAGVVQRRRARTR